MGASGPTPRESLDERLEGLQATVHGIPAEDQVSDVAAANAETLMLDRDEMQMLEAFHRSFNLPGLKHGLVRAMCEEDWLPPEEDEEVVSSPPPQQQFNEPPPPQQQQQQQQQQARRRNPAAPPLVQPRRQVPSYGDDEPEAAKELSDLLARTRGLHMEVGEVLEVEDEVGDEIVEAIAEEEEERYVGTEMERPAALAAAGSALISRGPVVRRPGSAAQRPGSSSLGSRPPSSSGVGSRHPSTGGVASAPRRRW